MEQELQEYGLSEKETSVYITLLRVGTCTASRISEEINMRRSTTYDILSSLKKKGLASSLRKEKIQYFQAAEPSELIALLREKEDIVKKILPDLEKIKETAREKPKLELYEGMKGVIVLLESIYKEKEILSYGSACRASEVLRHLPETLARRRVEKNILLRAVFAKSKQATFRIEDPEIKKVTEMRFLEEMKHFPSVTFVAGDHVGIVKLEDSLIGIHIRDKKIAETQRLIFESYWQRAKS